MHRQLQTFGNVTGGPDTPAALEVAERLRAALEALDLPAFVVPLAPEVVVSVWHGLVARTDGRMIWWTSPRRSGRGAPLLVLAYAPETAAVRIALDYADLRTARARLAENEHPRAGEPV
ncbi:hypothetical protein [Nonomuraea sediminis]|uniref:hypothetical protein n=1 Tax=Nonomuraea sediminis TaxID=2835864 RepID=UPI001BDDB4BA|nr:hypothetical protein [Nonomuraea sediminis]